MKQTEGNVLWEVVWATGQREIVEARNLQQGGGAFLASFDALMCGSSREPQPERWELFAEGRGLVWVAEKKLVQSIRCLEQAGNPAS